jgi:glycosyltransferase involved in cell wall biosynthesis
VGSLEDHGWRESVRIAQVSLQFEATTTGGGGVHVQRVTEHLLREGHEATILSVHTDKTLAGATLMDGRVPFSVQPRDGLQVVRLLIERGLRQPYGGTREEEIARISRFCDAALWWLDQHSGEFEVAHLHGHHLIPGYLAWRLRDKGFKVVSTIHFLESTLLTTDPEAMEHFRVADETLAQIKRWEAMARYADTIVPVSPQGREDLFSLMADLDIDLGEVRRKTRVVSSGVDREVMMTLSQVREKLAQIPDPVEIVVFSRLDPSKGVHYGVPAVAEAAKGSSRQLKLTLAGIPASESYLRLLEEQSAQVRDALSVEIHTFDRVFTPLARNTLLDRFHIYLLPTLNEPFGMTIIEAGARGKLIVTTDTAGPLYILDGEGMEDKGWGYVAKCGICAKRTEEPEVSLAFNLAKAINWTLEHWEESTERALAFVTRIRDRFTWRQVGQQYLELYEA